jgi:D-3-phosphoglycerate dehydrogenase / 2-oxoglutarate reductase
MKITRTSVSPYQNPDFQEKERAVFADFEKVGGHGEILITNTLTDITAIDTENLKLIIHTNSGYDNFPIDFVKKVDFPIIVGNEIRAQAVSEYILFCLFKRFGNLFHQTNWDRKLKNRYLLKEKNILIVGYGHVGTLVKKSLEPLAGNIFVVDPFVKGCSKSLNDVSLNLCDVVVLCPSLNPTSFQLINKHILEQLPKDLTLINPSRGNLVAQNDLIDFLKKNGNAFAFLDVFDEEPHDLAFPEITNLFTTSHIAGVFESLDDQIIDFERRVLQDFFNRSSEFATIYKNSLLKNRIKENFLV